MRKHRSHRLSFLFRAGSAASFLILAVLSGNASAQSQSENLELTASNVAVKKTNTSGPVFKEYRKIAIGTAADDLDNLLGEPDEKYPNEMSYEVSGDESVRIVIGPDEKVGAIVVTFAKGKGAPGISEVFGGGVAIEKRDDGSAYKMIRYPGAGYWVAYSAGAGKDAMVTLMMQKL